MSAVMQVGGSFGAAILVMELQRRIASNFSAQGIHLVGGSLSSLSSLPPAVIAHIGPLLADGFGYAFWWAFGGTAIALLPALSLLLLGNGGGEPADAERGGMLTG
jgi:hypothetical protein